MSQMLNSVDLDPHPSLQNTQENNSKNSNELILQEKYPDIVDQVCI